MNYQTIDAIDDTLVDTEDFLKEIIYHRLKHKCLKVFGECQGLIKWLRLFTTSKYYTDFILLYIYMLLYTMQLYIE